MAGSRENPKSEILFPQNAPWLYVRDLSEKVAKQEARALIRRYIEGDDRIMANHFGKDRYTLRASDSTIEIDLFEDDDCGAYVILSVSEA